MLKKAASFVLAALRGSTYGKEYASPPHLLRPHWTAFLTILWAMLTLPIPFGLTVFRDTQMVFQ
jgi:hypothetical protein